MAVVIHRQSCCVGQDADGAVVKSEITGRSIGLKAARKPATKPGAKPGSKARRPTAKPGQRRLERCCSFPLDLGMSIVFQ